MILTAGPSITDKEIAYVLDAVKHGWNEQWNNYLTRFESEFARFIGVRYALATSSCTGAMHLALLALGIGAGDEVIIPDLAWIATAHAVKYVGADVVAVDVCADTWCLDPEKVRDAITPRTRAIMPVHLYGHPCEMDEIRKIADEHGVLVIEDAAQAIGSEYRGRSPGGLGQIGCFSFQGAKIMVTGEGGMLVTDSEDLFRKAKFYNDHGRDPQGSFKILEVGYKYKMSNLQAALGLAQLERIEELVDKKRTIYRWYRERLKDVEGITLNVQKPAVRNNYWMTSIVLDAGAPASRDRLMDRLKKEAQVDSRTFYYPISASRHFAPRFENPVTRRLAASGINLPSGHNLTEEDVDWVSQHVRQFLRG